MIEMICEGYAVSCVIFLFLCASRAIRHFRMSETARGKEMKQFNRATSEINLSLIKWTPVWPWVVLKDFIAFVKWRRSR